MLRRFGATLCSQTLSHSCEVSVCSYAAVTTPRHPRFAASESNINSSIYSFRNYVACSQYLSQRMLQRLPASDRGHSNTHYGCVSAPCPTLVQPVDICRNSRLPCLVLTRTNSDYSRAGSLQLTKYIVDASPLFMQPYLRLIRLDRPIG